MIKVVNTLSITGACLLTALCMLTPACNNAEMEQMYTEKTQQANDKLKQEINRLKQDMRAADDTRPDTLSQIVERYEADLKAVQEEETAILKEHVALCEEWDQCKFRRAELTAATEELKAVFEKEMNAARKAKSNLSRNNEYFNQ